MQGGLFLHDAFFTYDWTLTRSSGMRSSCAKWRQGVAISIAMGVLASLQNGRDDIQARPNLVEQRVDLHVSILLSALASCRQCTRSTACVRIVLVGAIN
jgi:hypothetical protein